MQRFLPHSTVDSQSRIMGLALVFAVLMHIALFMLFEGLFKPKAYVVDQTSYRVSLHARADVSKSMPNPSPVVKQPPQVEPPPNTQVADKKTAPDSEAAASQVEAKPEPRHRKPQPPVKVSENLAKSSVEQVTSTEFKERRVSSAGPEDNAKPTAAVQQSASESTPKPIDKAMQQHTAAEPKQELAKTHEPSSLTADQPIEKVRKPQFQIGSPNNPKPTYPPRAINRGWEGDVVLGVHVDAEGTVTYVEILESSNVSALDFAAYSTVKDDWRFSPADEDERSLRGYVTVPISFRIN